MTSQGNEERIRRAAEELEKQWETASRWSGVERNYSPEEVVRLRGSFTVEHTIARRGAERLWDLVNTEDYVAALRRRAELGRSGCVVAEPRRVERQGHQAVER